MVIDDRAERRIFAVRDFRGKRRASVDIPPHAEGVTGLEEVDRFRGRRGDLTEG